MLNVMEITGAVVSPESLPREESSSNDCFDAVLSMLILGAGPRENRMDMTDAHTAEKTAETGGRVVSGFVDIANNAVPLPTGYLGTLPCIDTRDKATAVSCSVLSDKPQARESAQQSLAEGKRVTISPAEKAGCAIPEKQLFDGIELFGNYECKGKPIEISLISVKGPSFSRHQEVMDSKLEPLAANVAKIEIAPNSGQVFGDESKRVIPLGKPTAPLSSSYIKAIHLSNPNMDNAAAAVQEQPLIVQSAESLCDLKASVAAKPIEPSIAREATPETRLDDSGGESVNSSCMQVFGDYEPDSSPKLDTVETRFVDKIINEFKLISNKNNNAVRITLEPESLGFLTLKVVSDKNGVHAKIITESLQVMKEINRGSTALADGLNQLGIKFNGIEVSFKAGGDMMTFGEGLSHERQTNRGFDSYNGSAEFSLQDEAKDAPNNITGRVYHGAEYEYLA